MKAVSPALSPAGREAESRAFAQATLDSLGGHIAVLNGAGEILITNRAWRAFAAENGGDRSLQRPGLNYLAVCDAAAPDPFAARAAHGLRGVISGAQESFSLEYPCHSPTVERWYHLRVSRFDAPGPAAVVVCHDDITARVAVDRALGAARDHLRAVTDSMGEGLFTLDADGRVTYMNQVAERLLGWSLAELFGRPVQGLTHGLGQKADPSAGPGGPMVQAQRAGEVVRAHDDAFLRRDGTELPVAYTAAPLATVNGVQGFVVLFSDATERKAREAALVADAEKLTWIARINTALEEDRFVLHAQPIVDLGTGSVVQRELLVRMTDPQGAVIPPGAFLPTAEAYGLIGEIDRWVIRHGLDLAAADGQAVQINLSARSVGDQVVLTHIEQSLQQTGVDPALVVFEITETALIQDEAASRRFAERLHDLGCGLALDDFGTGYGGFTYLKRFPLDMVKIDIEFVRDAVVNERSRHVIQAVVALAASFDVQTVAEGIEDEATLQLVRTLGVNLGQGYHIARPGPIGSSAPGPPPQGRQDRSTP